MSDELQTSLIALGANATLHGRTPLFTLQSAIDLLRSCAITDLCVSHYYTSPAFPPGSGADYVNAAASFKTINGPHNILSMLHKIEDELGRIRGARWGARSVDLDLLAVGQQMLPNAAEFMHWRDLPLVAQMRDAPRHLILPHPRMQDRAFVLKPLADIAPDWFHPGNNRTVREMLMALPDTDLDAIVRII